MKLTFEELIKEYSFQDDNKILMFGEDCLELVKLVRQATLVEVFNKAEADFEIINTFEIAELFSENNIKYILKKLILELDDNSIEM